jgi:hypothetical protein
MGKIAAKYFLKFASTHCLLWAVLHAAAQEGVKIQPDRWEDKLVFEFTHDMWLNAPAKVDVRIPSPGFKAWFFTDYQFGESPLSFAWGFGISTENVHSNAEWVTTFDENNRPTTTLTPFPDGYSYRKNKFVTTHLEFPLELRIITKGKSPFKLATGFRVGYLLSDHQKIIDADGKRKFYNFESIERFRYGLSFRAGVGKVALTGYYSLVPLVQGKNGTDVVPVSLGIALTPIR